MSPSPEASPGTDADPTRPGATGSADAAAGVLVQDYLGRTAQNAPEAPALLVGDRTHSYNDLERASGRLAGSLQANGLVKGDRVAIVADNSFELVGALWATLRAGGVFVVVHPTTKADKLAFILGDSGVRAVVAKRNLACAVIPAVASSPSVQTVIWSGADTPSQNSQASHQDLDELIERSGGAPRGPQPIDADLAGLIYTSGSTGKPKGVMLTHRNVAHNTWSISTYLGLRQDDLIACLLPLSFDYGLFQIFMAARVGCAVALERPFAYPRDTLERLSATKATVLPGVPTVFATLLQQAPFDDLDLSTVRMLTNTAAALPPAHIERLQKAFPEAALFSMYGLTECTRVSYLPPDRVAEKPTSVGRAMPNTEAYVVGDTGQRAAPGVVGELVVRGGSVMRGYWNRPEETAACLRDGEIPGEKVLHTGDRFWADDEGFLYFVGRDDDVFKCKGEKISPREVEQVLYELESVAEAAVVGVPHEIDGTAIWAVVAPRVGTTLSEADVRRHCRRRLESYMVPRYIEITDELPKTDSGKIRKTALRVEGADLACAESLAS